MKDDDAAREVFLRTLGADIRRLREAAGISQGTLADLFEWQRAAISKIELGQRNLSTYEYLELMRFLAGVEPSHPAVALAERLLPPPRHR